MLTNNMKYEHVNIFMLDENNWFHLVLMKSPLTDEKFRCLQVILTLLFLPLAPLNTYSMRTMCRVDLLLNASFTGYTYSTHKTYNCVESQVKRDAELSFCDCVASRVFWT